jgi:adhesin transport system membrane fusion protein
LELELSFRNAARQELNQTMSELTGLSESSVALEDRVNRTAVRSPVRGTIKQLLVHTVGGVIAPGMSLVEIVPIEDTLLVEARIRPANIAFLRPGQEAIVKFTAYDFHIFGGLPAKLEHISADSILDEKGDSYYLVRVRTERSYLGDEHQPLPIISGMTTYVDILTGKKTVLSYLMKPLLRAKERALRER